MNAATLGALLLALITLFAHANDELDNWHTDPLPNFRATLRDVAHGKGVWVMVGTKGWASTDGTNWTATALGIDAHIVRYGNGRFVATGYGDYATSEDGFKWEVRKSPGNGSLLGWDGEAFVMGVGEAILRSSDAITWTRTEIPIQFATLRAVAENRYWVRNAQGAWTSTNLTSWQRTDGTDIGMPVTHFNGRYFARAYAMHSSTDGINWTDVGRSNPDAFAMHGDVLLMGSGLRLWTTLDGVSWTQRPTPYSVRGVASSGTKVVIAAESNFYTSASRDAVAPVIAAEIRAVVNIRGGRGRTYEIQSRRDAAAGNWITEAVVQATSEDFVWTDPRPLEARKIYRAVAK